MTLNRYILIGVMILFADRQLIAKPNKGLSQLAEFELGVFRPSPALTLYLVAPATTTLTLTISFPAGSVDEHVLVRLFDEQENILDWQELPSPPDGRSVPTLSAVTLKLQLPGMSQLRVVAGSSQAEIRICADRSIQFGVSFQNGRFTPWEKKASNYYFQVPAEAESLHIDGGPLTISGEQGQFLLEAGDNKSTKEIRWNLPHKDEVYVLHTDATSWSFQAWGFPLILCASPDLASRLNASVSHLPDGTLVTHAFQKKIAALLPSLVSPAYAGLTEDLLEPWALRGAITSDQAAQSLNLFSPYSSLMAVSNALSRQNLNPNSPWAGVLTATAQSTETAPWNSFILRDKMWGGFSPHGMEAEGLAFAATLNAPFNPYFGKKALLYRAAAASLRDLMALGADEVWPQTETLSDPYPGFMAFPVGQKNLRAFYFAAPKLPQEVREVWTNALRHIVDRAYPSALTSARNQSAHFVLAFSQFAFGSDLPLYRKIAQQYSERFAASASPPGYFMDASGPDATYTGMTHWHIGWAHRIQPNAALLESIRRSYYFWNHTVAPEPGGEMLGASNLNHRTAGSFVQEQWSGARGILDDILPEVALWAKNYSEPPEVQERLLKALANPPQPDEVSITTPRFLYWSKAMKNGVWPAVEAVPFFRTFGVELSAIKRPGYYAVVYYGRPAPSYITEPQRETFALPRPSETNPEHNQVEFRKVAAFNGGGLSLFWTPDYGASILAANWSPMTHHGFVGIQQDGQRVWEEYSSPQATIELTANRLTITGTMHKIGLRYQRCYVFEDDQIRVVITISATEPTSLAKLLEIIPLAGGKAKALGARISQVGLDGSSGKVAGVKVCNSAGAGISISFQKPQTVFLNRPGLQLGDLSINRVEIELPASWKTGEKMEFIYTLRPLHGPN